MGQLSTLVNLGSILGKIRMEDVSSKQDPRVEKVAKIPDRPRTPNLRSLTCFAPIILVGLALTLSVVDTTDLRLRIIGGLEPCFHYDSDLKLFQMNCSVLDWKEQGYGGDTFISLGSREEFDGSGSENRNTGRHIIDLTGIDNFKGLFTVSGVTSFAQAPIVRNVHISNGELDHEGGFILREGQHNFLIESCSSTGDISDDGGGICGERCGNIRITNSYSTGLIGGSRSGGIAGRDVGGWGAIVNITHCFSTGDIASSAKEAGGIVGRGAGNDNGLIIIEECYSTGQISGEQSGGITGSEAGRNAGKVNIINCYTRGDILGFRAGGITGYKTGSSSAGGHLYINNTYASGALDVSNNGGGMIGSIDSGSSAHNIHVKYSVCNGEPIVGRDPLIRLRETANSPVLDKIRGKLYSSGGIRRWNDAIWALDGDYQLPRLRFELPLDLRENIKADKEPCFRFISQKGLFQMNCSILEWRKYGYGNQTYISLHANEIFDSEAPDGSEDDTRASIIDLTGINSFEGLFRIDTKNVETFAEAPLIRNVHVENGKTARYGGFIVQRDQRFFTVDSCSSTGDIADYHSGGICGAGCGFNAGEVKITNSHATGPILLPGSGGITGSSVGYSGGIVHIIKCYSTGIIGGLSAGGICGMNAGIANGQVYITQSYSTGNVEGPNSGGISGGYAGRYGGYAFIKECYTTGIISSDDTGGITGSCTAGSEGSADIVDCYTRGAIDGFRSGGIMGSHNSYCDGSSDSGTVNISNSYTSGTVSNGNGGFIGHLDPNFANKIIYVQYSVYNGPSRMIGSGSDINVFELGISENLTSIHDRLYHYDNVQRWTETIWTLSPTDRLPILRYQLPSPSPTPSPSIAITPTGTATHSMTSSKSTTSTPSSSRSETPTKSPTATITVPTSETPTHSPTATITGSTSETPTNSATATATVSASETRAVTPTTTATHTSSSSSILCSPKAFSINNSDKFLLVYLKSSTPIQKYPVYPSTMNFDTVEMESQFLYFQTKLSVPSKDIKWQAKHFDNLLPYVEGRLGYSVFSNNNQVCIFAGLWSSTQGKRRYNYSNDICCSKSDNTAFCTSEASRTAPKPRGFSSSWSYRNEHYVFGGQSAFVTNVRYGLLNDLWKYKMDTGTWSLLSSNTNGPSERRDSSTWVLGDAFLLFGGYGFGIKGANLEYLDDLWHLHVYPGCKGKPPEWTKIKPRTLSGNFPASRRLGSTTVVNSVALMFGGESVSPVNVPTLTSTYLSDLWGLEFCSKNETWQWKELTPSNDVFNIGGRIGSLLAAQGEERSNGSLQVRIVGGYGYQGRHSALADWEVDAWSIMLHSNQSIMGET